jgi:3-dehydroquinate dehydratase-2
MPKIIVIHGPNLNLLGRREPHLYGTETLADIDERIRARGRDLGLNVETFQSNHEGAIVDKIHQALDASQGMVINPAALTHTSVAIRDALSMLAIPVIEVHLSNIFKREKFRHRSMVTPVVTGQIAGLGAKGYLLAVEALAAMIAAGPAALPAKELTR